MTVWYPRPGVVHVQPRCDEARLAADAVAVGIFQRLDQVKRHGGGGLEGSNDGLSLEILDNLGHVGLPLCGQDATNGGRRHEVSRSERPVFPPRLGALGDRAAADRLGPGRVSLDRLALLGPRVPGRRGLCRLDAVLPARALVHPVRL